MILSYINQCASCSWHFLLPFDSFTFSSNQGRKETPQQNAEKRQVSGFWILEITKSGLDYKTKFGKVRKKIYRLVEDGESGKELREPRYWHCLKEPPKNV